MRVLVDTSVWSLALREHLRAFVDLELSSLDFEKAAEFYNLCRSHGIQGSNTDFLICAVAANRSLPIFTTDLDFEHFRQYLPIRLHHIRVQ